MLKVNHSKRTSGREVRLLSSSYSVALRMQAILDWSSLVFFSAPFWRSISVGMCQSACVHAQLCPTLCDPMDCSPPGSSVHGILQTRILEWVAMPLSKESSWSRDQSHISCVSCIAGRFFTWQAKMHSFSFQFLSQTYFKSYKTFLLTLFEGKETCCSTDFRLGAACPLPGRGRPGPCRPHTSILIENRAAWGRNQKIKTVVQNLSLGI